MKKRSRIKNNVKKKEEVFKAFNRGTFADVLLFVERVEKFKEERKKFRKNQKRDDKKWKK